MWFVTPTFTAILEELMQATKLAFDQEQAQAFLKALGYNNFNQIRVRAFLPGDAKQKDSGRKADGLKPSQVEEWQAEGRGVYFVVNGWGHTDAEVQDCRAIFYEHDDLDKEIQLGLWESLGLPHPTVQVDTGGKSIHSYWVFKEPISVADWRLLQTDLLEMADADRKLKNPSRVMRLAGAWHISAKGTTQSKIVSCLGDHYSYGLLRKAIPRQKPEATPLLEATQSPSMKWDEIRVPIDETIDLEICLSKESRNLLSGISEGGRNDAGAKLARDLLGTASYLQSIGQRFNGDPEDLLYDFAARCNPPLPTREIDQIIKSAKSSRPSSSCPPNAIDSCIQSWKWRQIKQERQDLRQHSQAVNIPAPEPEKTQERLEKTLSEFEGVVAKLAEISTISGKAKQFYDYTKFRKEIGLSDRELKQIWQLSQLEHQPFNAICVHEFIGSDPESRKWLIPKFIPSGSLMIWYAEGGKGKTLCAYDAVRCIASGSDWLGSRVHQSNKCLIIQTEESKADTQDRLIIQGYLESVPANQVLISNKFTFSQIDELAEFIKKHGIMLVVVDSLTTANQDNSAGENDVAYGNAILELRDKIVNPLGCAVLIIHHENKNFSMRGSSAIKANVDFVVRLHSGGSEDKLSKTERILELEKARGGIMGRYVINLNTFDYHWSLVGEVDEYGNRKVMDNRLAIAIYNHLELNPGKEFTTKEIFNDLDQQFLMDVIRSEVEVLRRIGEIGGRYKQVTLEDGSRFGYWKYYAIHSEAQATEVISVVQEIELDDEIEEEF
ncbi:MAG TPA: AAA family ATPase [Cyanophyceae cyanobacterium]